MAAARPLPPRRGLCGAGCARCALGGTASAFGHSALKFAQRPAWPGRGKGLQGPHSVGQPCGSTATRTCNAAPSKVGGEPEGSVDSDNQRAPLRPIVHLHTVLLAWLQLDPLSAADDQSNADSPAARRDIFRPLKKSSFSDSNLCAPDRLGCDSFLPARNQRSSPEVNSLRSDLRCYHHPRSSHSPFRPSGRGIKLPHTSHSSLPSRWPPATDPSLRRKRHASTCPMVPRHKRPISQDQRVLPRMTAPLS